MSNEEIKLESKWILWNHKLDDNSWTNDSYNNIFEIGRKLGKDDDDTFYLYDNISERVHPSPSSFMMYILPPPKHFL